MLKYEPLVCSNLTNQKDCCSKAAFTNNCFWTATQQCLEYDPAFGSDSELNTFCHPNFTYSSSKCPTPDARNNTITTAEDSCEVLSTCAHCQLSPYCAWNGLNGCYLFLEKSPNRTLNGPKTAKAISKYTERPHCDPPCYLQTTCENCTLAGNCMWIESRCIESNGEY